MEGFRRLSRRRSSIGDPYDPQQHREFVQGLLNKELTEHEPKHQLGPDHIIDTDAIYTWQPDGVTPLGKPDSHRDIEPKSVITGLVEAAQDSPDVVAMAVKRDENEWTAWTYKQYLHDVRTVAKALIKLGLEPNHSVSIVGFNSPEWFLSDLGAIFAGGIATGIYTTNLPEACHHVISDSLSQIVVVEDEVQLVKILAIRSRLPGLKAIIQYVGDPARNDVLSWADVMELGESVPDEVLDRRIRGISINQCCTLVYTSGTTGNPKGVMCNHDYFNFMCKSLLNYLAPGRKNGRLVSYLPLNHVVAQFVDVYCPIFSRSSVYFAKPDALKGSLKDTLLEVRPTDFVGVPRIWEKFHTALKEKESSLSFFTKGMLSMAKGIGTKASKLRNSGSRTLPMGYGFANAILKKIHSAIGIDQTIYFGTISAPIEKHVLEYFQSLNLNILEAYGMSETGACISNRLYDNVVGSVGYPLPYTECKLCNVDETGEGEVLMRGRNRFMGYFRDEAKTKETIDDEGWCHSGDLGRMDEKGRLYITGRSKELVITAGGENVPPVYIEENIKKELPVLSNVMVVGDKKKFLCVLVTIKSEIDLETGVPLGKLAPVAHDWCAAHGLEDINSVQDILFEQTGVVRDAIQAGIDRANQHAISNAQKIQKFTILPVDFSVPGEELSPTLKLRRSYVMKKYSELINKMYPED